MSPIDPAIGGNNLIFQHPKHICYLFCGSEWYVSGDQGLDYDDMKDVKWSHSRELLRDADPEIRLIHIVPSALLPSLTHAFMYIEKTDEDGRFLDATPNSTIISCLVAVGIKAYKIYVTKEDQKWHKLSVDLKQNPKQLNR
jgi:hypothetical protein